MSINTASSPTSCYENRGIWMERLLAKPGSADLFVRNLQLLLAKDGKSAAALARHLGVNRSLITAWIQRRSHPGVERLSDIAEYFDVTIAALFRDPSDSTTPTITISVDDALRVLAEAVKKSKKSD